MKNKMFTTIALCAASLAAPLGAWAYDAPTPQTVEPNLATDGTGGGVYYVYNVGTQMWLTAAGNYGTQLCVAETGLPVTLAYGEEREALIGQGTVVPGEGWIFNMMDAPSNSGFHEVYLTSTSEAYVDCNTTGHTLWQIIAEDNGCYLIKIVEQDPVYGSASDEWSADAAWGVVPGYTTVIPMSDSGLAGYETVQQDWQFVTSDDYDTYQAKLTLLTQLEYAESNGYTDVSTYEALYNSDDATASELSDAASELRQAVINSMSSSASEDNPLEFTSMIVNSSFDSDNSEWTEDGGSPSLGHQSGTSYQDPNDESILMEYFCEKWVAGGGTSSMHLYQTLSSMPAGLYKLTAKTIAYQQSDVTITPYGVYVFAETNGTTVRSEAHTLEFNGLANGSTGTNIPTPRLTEVEFYSRGGEITVGFMTDNTNCNWVAVDDFELYYYGEAGGLSNWLEKKAQELEDEIADLANNNVTYSLANEEKATALVTSCRTLAANASATDDELAAAVQSIDEMIEDLSADQLAYTELSEFVTTTGWEYWEGVYENLEMADLDAYVSGLETAYNNRTFDPAEIDGVETKADSLFRVEIAAAIQSGETVYATGLLVNPQFTDNNDGWTKTGDGTYNNSGYHIAEVWNGTDWDVYQEVTDLPEGFYRISAQAFFSPSSPSTSVWYAGWGVTGDQINTVMASIYGNDASEKLVHEAEYAQDSPVSSGWEQVTGTADDDLNGKWIPVDQKTSYEAFSLGDDIYNNSVDCYVDTDGALRLGIVLAGVTRSQSWVAFDNFRVEYLGDESQDGAASAIQSKITEAQAVLTDGGVSTLEAIDGLQLAIISAQNVLTGTITSTIFKETMASLNSAIAAGETALDLVDEANTLATAIDKAYNNGEYDDYDQDDLEDLVDVVGEVFDIYDEEKFETAEVVQGYIDDMNTLLGTMLVNAIDYSSASKTNVADMTALISNPSFQTDDTEDAESTDTGWTISNTSSVAHADNLIYEFWDITTADIHQTLYSLPQGYYTLLFNGFYRQGSTTVAGVAHRDGTEDTDAFAYAYATTAAGNYTKTLTCMFDEVRSAKYVSDDVVLADSLHPDYSGYVVVPNNTAGVYAAFEDGLYEDRLSFYLNKGEEVTIGVKIEEGLSTDWIAVDDFQLYYLGDGEDNNPNAIEAVTDGTAAETVSSAWYTVGGVRVAEPSLGGIYIRQDVMSDGSTKTVKVLVK